MFHMKANTNYSISLKICILDTEFHLRLAKPKSFNTHFVEKIEGDNTLLHCWWDLSQYRLQGGRATWYCLSELQKLHMHIFFDTVILIPAI